ncbi:MAG: PP2C family protein-serine/threonine phosphatase, partial [Planctomycetota bacterium]
YCAKVGVDDLPEDEKKRVEAIVDHLLEDPCPDLHLGEGTLRPLAELKREATYRELRRRVKKELTRNGSWQLMDTRRRWFCPFCGEATDIEVPKDRTMTENVLRDLCLHIETCFAYSHGKGQEKPLEALKNAVKAVNRGKKLADDVRRKLEGDPLWRQKDSKARWTCPFCLRVLEHIDLSSNLVMFETAPALIAQHLLSPCEPWKAGQAPRQASNVSTTPSGGMARIVRPDPLPLKPRDEQSSNGKPHKTFRQMESSGEFDLIDDPEVRKLTGSGSGRHRPDLKGSSTIKASPDSTASVEWRREIERELAEVKNAVPGVQELSGSLEDTEQAEARESAKVADSLPGFEVRLLVRSTKPPRGDFAEVIRLDSQRLGIIVGGVTGTETEGALVAAMARNLMRIHARTERDPAQVLRNVNSEVFQDLDARTFIAATYAVLEGPKRTLHVARAGMTAPFLVNPKRSPVLSLIDSEGMVMGIDKGPIFDQTVVTKSVEFGAGDLIVLAANGVLEVRNRNRDELGLERLMGAVRRYGTHEAEYLTHKLGQLLTEFSKDTDPSSDVCVLAMRYTGTT